VTREEHLERLEQRLRATALELSRLIADIKEKQLRLNTVDAELASITKEIEALEAAL
jgi:septal ring factor EnvC (AmiA/AmiB activator)